MGLKVKEKELRKGFRSAGRILVQEEREGWRRVAKNRTGATERSIGIVNERSGQTATIGIGPRLTRNRETSGFKAWWFEKGTKFMRPRPFIGPAERKASPKMEKVIGTKIVKTLERTARRNAKR